MAARPIVAIVAVVVFIVLHPILTSSHLKRTND